MPSAVLASKCEILPEWVFCGCVTWGHTLQQFGGWFYMFSWGYNCLFNSLYCIKYTTRRYSYLDLSTDYHKPCRKKYSEKDVVTLWPVLLNERCVISLCISSCYFTMGCLNRTGYKYHHPSAKELKNSVAAGDCSVLFSPEIRKDNHAGFTKLKKTLLVVQGRCPFTKLGLEHTIFSQGS